MSCGQYSTREINITIFFYIKATYIYILDSKWSVLLYFIFYESIKESEMLSSRKK